MSGKLYLLSLQGTVRVMDGGTEIGLHLERGDEIPAEITDASLAVLKKYGEVGSKEDVARIEGGFPVDDGTVDPIKAAAGDGEPVVTKPDPPDLSKLAEISLDDLTKAIEAGEGVSIKALVEAVGTDKELAAKVLDAEKAATKNDPRASLVKALEKVVGAE